MVLLEEFQVLVNSLAQEKLELLNWQELMELRQKIGENVEVKINEKLSQYEEKIGMKQKFQALGIPTSQVTPNNRSKSSHYSCVTHCLKTTKKSHFCKQSELLRLFLSFL